MQVKKCFSELFIDKNFQFTWVIFFALRHAWKILLHCLPSLNDYLIVVHSQIYHKIVNKRNFLKIISLYLRDMKNGPYWFLYVCLSSLGLSTPQTLKKVFEAIIGALATSNKDEGPSRASRHSIYFRTVSSYHLFVYFRLSGMVSGLLL